MKTGRATRGHPLSLRLHAHCTAQPAKPGSVTLAFANMAEAVTFNIVGGSSIISGARTEYRITKANSSQPLEQARELIFNDGPVPLFVGTTGALPALVGDKAVAGASLIVASETIGWAVFADAKASACM